MYTVPAAVGRREVHSALPHHRRGSSPGPKAAPARRMPAAAYGRRPLATWLMALNVVVWEGVDTRIRGKQGSAGRRRVDEVRRGAVERRDGRDRTGAPLDLTRSPGAGARLECQGPNPSPSKIKQRVGGRAQNCTELSKPLDKFAGNEQVRPLNNSGDVSGRVACKNCIK